MRSQLLEYIIEVVVLGLLHLPQVVDSFVHALHAFDCVSQLVQLAFVARHLCRLFEISFVQFGHALNLANQIVHFPFAVGFIGYQ